MSGILNLSAIHDSGAPKATVGIRGDSFQLKMDTTTKLVSLINPLTNLVRQLRADIVLSDDSLAEDRIIALEENLQAFEDMILEDNYTMPLADNDGYLLVDNDDAVLVDNWTVFGAIDDLTARMNQVENYVGDDTYGLVATVENLYMQVDSLVKRMNSKDDIIDTLSKRIDMHDASIISLTNSKANKATTLAGYGITDAYTKNTIDEKLAGALHYKGSYETFAALTAAVTAPAIGDVYNIATAGGTDSKGTAIKAGDNVAAYYDSGVATPKWDILGGTTDLSAYYTKTQVNEMLDGVLIDETLSA